jgi:hypothetical protein
VSEGIGIRLLNGWWEPGEGCCTRTEIIPRASRAGIPQRGHDLAGLSKNMVVASIFMRVFFPPCASAEIGKLQYIKPFPHGE